MKYRYCANLVEDLPAFKQTVTNMGGKLVFNPLFHDGFYQCWFDVDSKLELDETITFTTLQTGVQSIVQIKMETD